MIRRNPPTTAPSVRSAPGTPVLAPRARRRSVPVTALALVAAGVLLAACSLHVTKNGFSGDILGHKVSGSSGALPAGFPSDVPSPDNSRVIGGGSVGDSNGSGYDAAFAVTGDVTTGLAAYEAKFQSAGYTLSNVENPPATTSGSPSSGTASGSGATTTTVTVTGGTFTATNSQWVVQVEAGSSSSATEGLKPGEFGVNLTVVTKSLTTTTTTNS